MLDLFLSRRSIRSFENKKIEKEKIDILLEGALTSPSGRNSMPWELVVVDDKNILDKLSRLKGEASEFINKAPLAIVVAGDESLSDLWVSDCSIISGIIQILAHSLGLGSCWNYIMDVEFNGKNIENEVKSILGLPKNLRVLNILSLGYPAETKPKYEVDNLNYNLVNIIK